MKGIASACVAGPIAFAMLSRVAPCSSTTAAEGGERLTKHIRNPVASLISVPVRVDYSRDIGPLEVESNSQVTRNASLRPNCAGPIRE